MWSARTSASDGVQPGLPRSDPDCLFNVGDKYLAVADPTRLGGATDRIDGFFDHIVTEYNFNFHLGEKINDVLGTAIEFGVPLLPAEALGFGYG